MALFILQTHQAMSCQPFDVHLSTFCSSLGCLIGIRCYWTNVYCVFWRCVERVHVYQRLFVCASENYTSCLRISFREFCFNYILCFYLYLQERKSNSQCLFVNSVLIMPSVPIYWHEGRIHSVFSLVLLQLYLLLLFLHSGRKVEFTVLFINSASIISFVCMST